MNSGRLSLKDIVASPEVAIPAAVLGVGLLVIAGTFALIRPDPTIGAALVAAVAATYGTVLSIVLTRYYERRKETQTRFQELERGAREKRIPEYERFVGFLFSVFFADKLGKKPLTQAQIVQGFIDWTKPLLLWGSDEVVKDWGRLRVDLAGGGGTQGLFRLENLLLQLRRDAGYPSTQLSRGDILRLWVNDIDKYLGDDSGNPARTND